MGRKLAYARKEGLIFLPMLPYAGISLHSINVDAFISGQDRRLALRIINEDIAKEQLE